MNGKYFRFFERHSKSAVYIVSALGFSSQSFAYPPLPAYGTLGFANGAALGPTCTAIHGTPTTVSWSARPYGYGYQASQYICSVQYYISGASGGTCTGGSAVISPTGMYTDGAGTLNGNYSLIKFIMSDTNNNCTSTASNVITLNAFVGCSLANFGGGAFASGSTYGTASCTAT